MAGPPPDVDPYAGQPLAVQAAFLKLRSGFLAGLPQRWVEIEAAPSDAARQQALHRLAGAAGSYGCTALGEAARAAEQALGQDSAVFVAALLHLQRQLQSQLQSQSQSQSPSQPHSDTVR